MSARLRQIGLFFRLSRPLFLLGGFLLNGLGGAILLYLHRPLDLRLYLIGQALVTALQLMGQYLNEYHDTASDADNPSRTPLTGGSGALGAGGLPRKTALYAAIVSLTVAATLASLLLVQALAPPLAWVTLVLAFLGAFFYSVPPVRLAVSGYGELTTSILVAGLVPTFAFALQTGEMHPMLWLSTVPLVALHFAMMLAFELPDFAADTRSGKRPLMIRLGWQWAMRLHDGAILFAIAAFVVAFARGLPTRVALGALIAAPLALAQIWQMARIRAGSRPHWRTLTFSALGLFALTAYLELAGFLLAA